MATLTNRQELAKDYAVEARMGMLKESFRILADYPTGVGLGNFPMAIGPYNPEYWNRSSHNTFVTCFVELGIFGGMLFLALLGGSLWLLYRTSRIAHLTEDPLGTKYLTYGLIVSFATYVVAGLGTERFSCESFWWVLVLPLCANRMAMREVREVRATVPVRSADAIEEPALWGNVAHAV
jgi:O-antigen ligase